MVIVLQCDILNLEFTSKGRDIDIIEPVLSYLELKYKLKIVRESLFNLEFKLLKYNPKMLVISNEIGAYENFIAVKLASKLGIKIVTLISEGDYVGNKARIEGFFWGWNKDHIFYEDLHLEWSQRNIDIIYKFIPGSESFNIKVSGATGFDRYKILPFMTKEEFLAKYNKAQFKKVVGLGGFNFDHLLGDYFQQFEDVIVESLGERDLQLHRAAKEALRTIYRDLIERNPDTLFILKHHPGVWQEELTELYQLDKYENTVVIRGKEENIADVINASDIWIAYNSTTVMEAWLLGKQTMFVNPEGGDFKRSSISKGSPIKTTFHETQVAIDKFYALAEIPSFKELEGNREQAMNEIIGWDDGKNHMRAGDYIYDLFIDNKKKHKTIDSFVLKRLFKTFVRNLIFKTGLIKLSPFAKKYKDLLEFNKLFDPAEREAEHQKYLRYLKEFYARNNIQFEN